MALGPTGGGVSGRASGVVEGSVDLGGADLSAQASGEIAGLAKFGITASGSKPAPMRMWT
ncbi:hypothetical protein FUT87_24075 [Mitsuaria sp. TWR114]|uniref:hypothetical protein n=1 Tax=Mitsuaria sp. TWR114 TaxID=2601731 RepID=UPI0011BEC132|nr:hypothetical protein [Mitsuaria sp. TWR114]TXD73378.1 hypothetical protein FUT87_24075 [Mitsuaria sp. TWR114]